LGLPSPRRLRRDARRIHDLASRLDAGLSLPDTASASREDGSTIATLRELGTRLAPIEAAVLTAAAEGGFVPAALRRVGDAKEARADQVSQLLGRLAYPVLLLCGVTALTILGAIFLRGSLWPLLVAAAGPAAAVVLGVLLWLGLTRPTGWTTRVPVLGPWLQGFGEIPYLEAMTQLYGAGVPLVRGHGMATNAVPTASVRVRLRVAQRSLDEGRSLEVALARSGALHPESRELLAAGEASGTLEDAFARATNRRRQVIDQTTSRLVRGFSALVYGLAALAVLALALEFYGGLYGSVLRGGR